MVPRFCGHELFCSIRAGAEKKEEKCSLDILLAKKSFPPQKIALKIGCFDSHAMVYEMEAKIMKENIFPIKENKDNKEIIFSSNETFHTQFPLMSEPQKNP